MGPRLLLLFIVGDILGAGIYAVTGEMALEVGGIVWVPFLVAFAVATLTALSYLELVTNHPQAAGAALYTHKAFGIHFVTFLVAFGVIASGITSASTSSNLLAVNLLAGLNAVGISVSGGTGTVLLVALAFMVLLAVINLRGVGESVKFNVLLTLIEIAALVIVIGVGFYVMAQGDADLGRVVVFNSDSERGMFAAVTVATAIAFFAMVGFEDSVNMVEEVKDPERNFPRMMLTGLGIAVVCYILVALSVIAVIPEGRIESVVADEGKVLLEVVTIGAPGIPIDKLFPFLTVVAVANTALINMLMASRLPLRHGPTGCPAPPARQGAPWSSYAVGGHRLLHPAVARPDRRGHRDGRERGDHLPRGHHRTACCCASSRSSTLRAWSCAVAPAATSPSGRRRSRRGSVQLRACSSPDRGRATARTGCSTRSPAPSWCSASCSGWSPGSRTGPPAPRQPGSTTWTGSPSDSGLRAPPTRVNAGSQACRRSMVRCPN